MNIVSKLATQSGRLVIVSRKFGDIMGIVYINIYLELTLQIIDPLININQYNDHIYNTYVPRSQYLH